jgi:hypothetical protein
LICPEGARSPGPSCSGFEKPTKPTKPLALPL